MNRLNTYQLIAMGVMVLIIILLSQCNGNLRSKLDLCLQGCEGKETVRIDTVELPAPPPDTIKIPILKPYEVRVPDLSLQRKIDSLLQENEAKDVLLAYYEERYYKRVLKDDSIAYAVIFDTVSENSLKEGRFIFELRQKPQRITTTITTEKELRFRLFAGGFIGGQNFEAGLSALAIPANDRFAVRYDYDLINRGHRIGVLWKLGFRR